MQSIRYIGTALFVAAFLLFIALPFMNTYKISDESLALLKNEQKVTGIHEEAVFAALEEIKGQEYGKLAFLSAVKTQLDKANVVIEKAKETDSSIYGLGSYQFKEYSFWIIYFSGVGLVAQHSNLFLILILIGLIIGGLINIIPRFFEGQPGIKNNGVFFRPELNRKWSGIILGTFMIVFYILLYFYPKYIPEWVNIFNPLSFMTNGGYASQWYMYGLLYTIAVFVMGIRMIAKYRHSRYQIIRTCSVMFFQLTFAFMLPEILAALNQPYMDFKNIWPLDYSFFYDYRINGYLQGGSEIGGTGMRVGMFMFIWGLIMLFVAVPLFTYLYGKRWYCSWVCGCGGLAETLGDPFRQQSDKSLRAWQIERYLIHGVLVFAVVMTSFVLYTYFTGKSSFLGLDSYWMRDKYGFLISSIFAGVVGTGFYPLMGNRVWCRFGCPLAAIYGIIQRTKSRFRITTNGGQCISCGNCSTYCEMGIDVRAYAQKGQNIVRASCVGCGVCSAVCPRGVLSLENGPLEDRINEGKY